MVATLNWLLVHWWVFFWLAVFGVFRGARDFFVSVAKALGSGPATQHQRELERIRAQGLVPPPGAVPVPGRCVHRRVKQIRDVHDELVGWLCTSCDTQLPADWAIAKEDL